jgi:hypothetical protein
MYSESSNGSLFTVYISCDARSGKGVCQNSAEITMQNIDWCKNFLLGLGWRLLRGHQVCGQCVSRGRVVFPRKAKIKEIF